MAFTGAVPTYICNTEVKAGQGEAFEQHIRDVVVPAIVKARPDLADDWTLLKPMATESEQPSIYTFLFFGSHPIGDWALGPILTAAELETFHELTAGQVVWGFAGAAV